MLQNIEIGQTWKSVTFDLSVTLTFVELFCSIHMWEVYAVQILARGHLPKYLEKSYFYEH